MTTYAADTSVRNGATPDSATVSNATNTTPRRSFRAIDEAQFVICLDDEQSMTEDEESFAMLQQAGNRWYDKHQVRERDERSDKLRMRYYEIFEVQRQYFRA